MICPEGFHEVIVDLSTFYTSRAKLSELSSYIQKTKDLAGNGNKVIITGVGPVWLYLKIAHALHGKAKSLIYRSKEGLIKKGLRLKKEVKEK